MSTVACTDTSRPDVGSRMTTLGQVRMRASPTRRCLPARNLVRVDRDACRAARPLEDVGGCARRARPRRDRCGSPAFVQERPIFQRGSSDAPGPDRRIAGCDARRAGPPATAGRSAAPRNQISPHLTWMPMMVLPSVDLPQPDSPTSPKTSPGIRSNETPSTALDRAMRRERAAHGKVDPQVAHARSGAGSGKIAGAWASRCGW